MIDFLLTCAAVVAFLMGIVTVAGVTFPTDGTGVGTGSSRRSEGVDFKPVRSFGGGGVGMDGDEKICVSGVGKR